MHELSIAMSMIEMAQEEAASSRSRVEAIYVKLGGLSGVVKEALLSSFEIACEGTSLQGAQLFIEEAPVIIFCNECNSPQTVQSLQMFCCPLCGTPSGNVVQGKEIEVVALSVVPCGTEDMESGECAQSRV
jgi:hydrogenase nickel incorporation protein HypA/HybF